MTNTKTWVLEPYTWLRCSYKCPYTLAPMMMTLRKQMVQQTSYKWIEAHGHDEEALTLLHMWQR